MKEVEIAMHFRALTYFCEGFFLTPKRRAFMKKMDIKKASVAAMLCAVSYLCLFLLKIEVYGFLSFDLKNSFLAIVAFLYGPLYGVASAVLVAFMEIITIGKTGFYGFLMDALSGGALTLCCGLVYKYKRSFSGAVVAAVTAVGALTAVMVLFNLIITPLYTGMASAEVAKMIPAVFLPFNLFKGTVNMAITLILYKPLTSALKRAGLIKSERGKTDKSRFVLLTVISVAILIASMLLIVFCMDGNISL